MSLFGNYALAFAVAVGVAFPECPLVAPTQAQGCEVRLQQCQYRLQAENRAYEALLAPCQPRIDPVVRTLAIPAPQPWYRSPWLWGTVGLGVGLSIGWTLRPRA